MNISSSFSLVLFKGHRYSDYSTPSSCIFAIFITLCMMFQLTVALPPKSDIDQNGSVDLRDAILVVESGAKPVSSSAGHSLMETNPFARVRFAQARENLDRLHAAMVGGDWLGFIGLMEEEALSLHAMMMTGRPGYLLMQPGTLSILREIRAFREETGCRLGFTLDAGANVHLLYAGEDAPRVEAFISSELLRHCENGRFISDRMGEGPQKMHL